MLWEVAQPLTSYFTSDGKLRPLLAESYTVAPDGGSVTFVLRQGIKFSDGTPFNADAVKVNLQRVIDPKLTVNNRLDVAFIDSIDVTDERHVKISLKQPISFFPYSLAYYVEAIVSPDSLTKLGNSYENVVHPIGTGPYKFVEYVKGSHVVLERNEQYWGKKPAWQRLQFKVIPEASSREAAVLSGDADIALSPPPADLDQLKSNSAVSVVVRPSNRAIFIAINTVGVHQPALKDLRVRQALNYAVDKQTIIKKVLFGLGEELDGPGPKSVPGYVHSGSYAYDPNKAKQLLQQAGVSGLTLKFGAPTGRYLQDFQAAQAVAGYLQNVGIKVDGPTTMDFPTYTKTLFVPPDKAVFDLAMLGLMSTSIGAQMEFFTSQYIPPTGLNFAPENNPQVDSLVKQANATSNTSQANDAYGQAQKLIWNDVPWIFLWTENVTLLLSKKIRDVALVPFGDAYVDDSSPA
jgi:peptide/nickel transport system substrate-binding protein